MLMTCLTLHLKLQVFSWFCSNYFSSLEPTIKLNDFNYLVNWYILHNQFFLPWFFLLILPTVVVILFNIPTKAPRLSTYFRPLYSPFQFSVQAIDIYTTCKVSAFLHVYVYVCKVCLFSLFICVKFDSFMAFQWVIFSFWLGLLRCFKLKWVL